MARNVEIKARVLDLPAVRERVEAIADSGPERAIQEDVFFHVRSGRLKLRKISGGRAELIQYDRSDSREPTLSDYLKTRCSEPTSIETALSKALGVRGVVRKEREVFLCGRTRIHLDRVEGLGDFLELEVVLSPSEAEAEGTRIAQRLLRELGIDSNELVDQAYIDLLEKSSS